MTKTSNKSLRWENIAVGKYCGGKKNLCKIYISIFRTSIRITKIFSVHQNYNCFLLSYIELKLIIIISSFRLSDPVFLGIRLAAASVYIIPCIKSGLFKKSHTFFDKCGLYIAGIFTVNFLL